MELDGYIDCLREHVSPIRKSIHSYEGNGVVLLQKDMTPQNRNFYTDKKSK